MDDTKLLESLQNLKEKATELVGTINTYQKTYHNKKILRTIRTLTSALGHAGKDFRAVSMAFEKAEKL